MATADSGDVVKVTVASKVAFGDLCRLLEKLDSVRTKKVANPTQVKKNHLKTFIDSWRTFHLRLYPDGSTATDSFYPAMRLLLPHLEKERVAYGIKEHTLAKRYIDVLCLGKESPDAKRLLEYKAPKGGGSWNGNARDFASVAYLVLKSRCPEKGAFTIRDVNDCLDSIAANNTGGNKEAVRSSICKLLRNLSAVEQKWLIRMIMKELRCGVSQQTIFNIFHSDAEDLFNVTNSLEKVCVQLHDPEVRLTEIAISLFSPFKPMLGDRGTPAKVEELMEGEEYFLETKYDGERFQIHKKGDEYKYFSRGGNDYTDTYGKDPFAGTLTPFIHNCFRPEVKSCIVDGEMMGYDPATKTLGSKGENFDIKSKDVFANVGYQPCFMIFDVLLYNDTLLTELPLKERSEYTEKVVNPVEGRISISGRRLAKTKEECAEALNEAIDNRDEGIMVKKPGSTYKANTRKGGWFKMKPDYVVGLMDELDLLIVGGYFGASLTGMLSHFLCGVAVPADGEDQPTVFHSFCKVGSGYTKKELFSLNRRLSDHWQPFKKTSPPSCLVLANGSKERPDVWIEPSKSAILQVKASELVYSASFQTGCTARFPRVEKIRTDKHWYDCMTTTELEELRRKTLNKLTNRYELDDDNGPAKKRRAVARASKPTVAAQFRGADKSEVQKTDEILVGKVFCIVLGNSELNKTELEKKVLELGGDITQNPDSSTTCIVAGKKSGLKISNFIKSGKYDIANADWLVKCIKKERCIPWGPSDLWYATAATEARFASRYDRYGDSYYDATDVQLLRQVFRSMEEKKSVKKRISSETIADLESEYFPDDSPSGLFRPCRFYLDDKSSLDDPSTKITGSSLELVSLEARFYGAVFSPTLDERVSHVIMDESDFSRLPEIRETAKTRRKRFCIVTSSWITNCIEEGQLVNERHYEPCAVSRD